MCMAFLLDCGHFTYIETQLGYDVWRPKNNRKGRFYYCENCSDWRHAKPKPPPPVYPEEPLF